MLDDLRTRILLHKSASPRRPPPPPPRAPWCAPRPPPQARPLVPVKSHTSSAQLSTFPTVCPPQAGPLALVNGRGAGGITHNTWNHKTGNHRGEVGKDNPQHREPGPLPLPLPFDAQMRMMAMMLCTMTLMSYSQCGCWWYLCSYVALGFGTAMLIALYSWKSCLACDVLANTVSTIVVPSQVSVGFVTSKLERVFE